MYDRKIGATDQMPMPTVVATVIAVTEQPNMINFQPMRRLLEIVREMDIGGVWRQLLENQLMNEARVVTF